MTTEPVAFADPVPAPERATAAMGAAPVAETAELSIPADGAAAFGIRHGSVSRAYMCPVTGQEIGQPDAWRVFVGMAALSTAAARVAAPTLAAWCDRLNAMPPPSAAERAFGIIHKNLVTGVMCPSCVSGPREDENYRWVEPVRRGDWEVAYAATNERVEGYVCEHHVAAVGVSRLRRLLAEVYGVERPLQPVAEPKVEPPEARTARERRRLEARVVRMVAQGVSTIGLPLARSGEVAMQLLEGFRLAFGLQYVWRDPADEPVAVDAATVSRGDQV